MHCHMNYMMSMPTDLSDPDLRDYSRWRTAMTCGCLRYLRYATSRRSFWMETTEATKVPNA